MGHPDRPQQTPHGQTQAHPINRLQQVIDGTDFECGDGVLRMGRDEADVRPFGELGEELEPRASGQLDIEEEDVGGMVLEDFACLRDAPRGAEHLNLPVGSEEVGEAKARRLLVVDEEGRGHRGNLSGRGDQGTLRGRAG